MKISKSLLAAMSLTLSTSLLLTGCEPDNNLTIKTEQQGAGTINPQLSPDWTPESNPEGNTNPEPCPACGMG